MKSNQWLTNIKMAKKSHSTMTFLWKSGGFKWSILLYLQRSCTDMKLKAGYQCSYSNMGPGGYQQHNGTSIIAATSDVSQKGYLIHMLLQILTNLHVYNTINICVRCNMSVCTVINQILLTLPSSSRIRRGSYAVAAGNEYSNISLATRPKSWVG